MSNFHFPKDLIIFDVETSATDPETASIIQIGAVKFNRSGYLERNPEGEKRYIIAPDVTFNEYVKPYTNEWSKEAFKIHKLEKSYLQEKGRDIETVLQLFETWIAPVWNWIKKDYWLAQWSCGFDTNMLRAAYKKVNREYPFHYRAFDIASIVRFELAKKNKLFMKSGENICARALGIEVDDKKLHNSLYDAQLSGLMLERIAREK